MPVCFLLLSSKISLAFVSFVRLLFRLGHWRRCMTVLLKCVNYPVASCSIFKNDEAVKELYT